MRNEIAMDDRCRGSLDQNCVLSDHELDLVTGGYPDKGDKLLGVLIAVTKAIDSVYHAVTGTSHDYGTGMCS